MSDSNEPEAIGDILEHEFDSSKNESTNMENKHGGKRPGAGRKKGSMNKATMDAKIAKKAFQQRVVQNADRLFDVQFTKAVGEQFLYHKYYTGSGKNRKPHVEQVTNPNLIKMYINGELEDDLDDGEWYWISTKPIDNTAVDSLLNRGFGKATEHIEHDTGFFKASKMIIEVVGEDYAGDVGDGEAQTEQEAETSD